MTTTPNMGMDVPVPSITLGPTYAAMLVTLLDLLDAHDHSAGKGVKITPLGMNITSDLAYGGNRASGVKSVQLATQGATLTGALDLGAVYQYAGDLYYTNLSGTAVKITSGGSLNSAALVSNLYAQHAVSTDIAIDPADSYVELVVDTTAGRVITLPPAGGVTAGRFYIIKDATGTAATNNITLLPFAVQTIDGAGSKTLSTNYGVWTVISDGVSAWQFSSDSHEIGGIQVTGTPAVGNVLRAVTATAAVWGALDLADTDAVTGVLPTANMTQATTATTGAVKLANDLAGTALLPTVVQLTGTGSAVSVVAAQLSWIKTVAPILSHNPRTAAGDGAQFLLQGQNAGSGAGGPVCVAGGTGTTLKGGVRMLLGGNAGDPMITAAEVASGREVVGLMGEPDAASVPSGNKIAWLGNLGTVPVIPPVGGCIIGSDAGNFLIFGANATAPFEIIGTTAATAGAVDVYLNVKYNGAARKLALLNV